MTMTTVTSGKVNADGSKADHAKNTLDVLPLPGGKQITECTNGQLASILMQAGVVGAHAENGRSKNLELYARHLAKIHKDAGDRAVADWVRSKS